MLASVASWQGLVLGLAELPELPAVAKKIKKQSLLFSSFQSSIRFLFMLNLGGKKKKKVLLAFFFK